MSVLALISVAEYLSSTYRPDCDFVEGELKERHVGEGPHADIQAYLAHLFIANRELWRTHPRTEQRVQVTATRYRIPDVCVLRLTDPLDVIVTVPPLICIEVLSRNDTLGELQERVADYLQMGVRHVWAIDPAKRLAYLCEEDGFRRVMDGHLTVVGTSIDIDLREVYAFAGLQA